MAICDTLKAFSDPVRQKIMVLLKDRKMTAGELANELNISPAALSYHLKMLKKADLLMEYKEKKYIWYEINTTLFDELILWLKQFGGKSDEISFSIENYTKIDISYFKKYINMIQYILEVVPSTVGRLLSSLGVQAQFT